MLSLESSRWAQLRHAYGPADDIPELLRLLKDLPASRGEDEPWYSLWSSLAHQGDVYSASFAAVPHVIEMFATNPMAADECYFHFPVWVEICRQKEGTAIPEDLNDAYFASLSRLPDLIAQCFAKEWNSEYARCALAAIAVAKGQAYLAEPLLELSSDVAAKFMDWFYDSAK